LNSKKDSGFMRHNLSHRKKIIFTVFTLAIAVALVLGLELALRAFHFGARFELVSVEEKAGMKAYRLNRHVGIRYFSKYDLLVPELAPETFSFKKSPQTFRVFCLGGSTMASFPFEHHARWHCLLQDHLSKLFPRKQIEIINVAMSAVNSFTVLDFARELVDYEPDLFLIYMGHNEFYGALGVGSVQTLGKNRWLINTYLKLQHLKLTQLLRLGIDGLRGLFQRSYPALHPEQTLMEMIARNRYIPYESEDFRVAAQSFEANLDEMIHIAQKHRIKVLVSTVVSNLNGLAPFHSTFSENLTENERANWEKEFSLGKQSAQQQTHEAALAHFTKAAKIDDQPAKLHFEIARTYEALGRYEEARRSYEHARDFDALRFRAPGIFNRIIHQKCADRRVPLVDMEATFARHSSRGIIGNQLLFEHVHPNFSGYTLMARAFAQAIIDHHLFASSDSLHARQIAETPGEMMELSTVTDLDVAIGNLKMARLVQRWPFRAEQFVEGVPAAKSDSVVTRFADDYINRRITWEEAHYRLAEHYTRRGNYERAEKEYRGVTKVMLDNYYPHFCLANLYFSQNRYAEAEAALQEALKRNTRSAAVHAKLGLLKLMQRDFGAARDQFQKALSNNRETHELTDSGIGSANYYLALACLQTGSRDEALLALQETLQWQPDHSEARKLIKLIESNQPVRIDF
jgi:tetratricopeptide (TPR) repeat protein